MMEEARKKLAGCTVDFHIADLSNDLWDSPHKEATFDAAVSVLVLEHLPFKTYRDFLQRVKRILKPESWFVAVEAFDGDILFDLYFKEMDDCAQDAIAQGIVAKDELEEFNRLSEEKETHYFAPMQDKMQWLADAGFEDVQSIWQYYCVGILAGRTPK
jgi:cyclopropane fatty-acyl-phospholipid synthase-like methyltransferase